MTPAGGSEHPSERSKVSSGKRRSLVFGCRTRGPAVQISGHGSLSTSSGAHLLVVEDSDILATVLVGWLRQTFPQKPVARACTIAEADELVRGIAIDFFLLDVKLPDGNGLDFMHRVRNSSHPTAPMVLVTGLPSSRLPGRVEALGPVCFLEKPLDMGVLERVLRAYLDPPVLGPGATSGSGFCAVLQNTQPGEVIRLKCSSGATSILEFLNPQGQIGRIYLRAGELVHAETSAALGIEALAEIVRWKSGGAREIIAHWERQITATIASPWESALMEATQLAGGRFEQIT